MKKRLFVGLLVGGIVFASAFGVAASLGVLTTADLGAAGQDVAVCDTNGMKVDWDTTYVAGTGFQVSAVQLSGVDASCIGSEFTVLLTGDNDDDGDDDNATLGTPATLVWDDDTDDTAEGFTYTGVDAKDVFGADVLVDGLSADTTP